MVSCNFILGCRIWIFPLLLFLAHRWLRLIRERMRARNPENRGRGGKEFDWKRGEGGDNDRKIVGGRGSIEKCRLGGGAIRPEPRPSRVCRPRVGIRRQEMPAEFPSGRIPFLGKGLGTPISRKFLSTIRSLHSPIALPSLYSNVVIKLFSTAFSNFDRSSNIKDGQALKSIDRGMDSFPRWNSVKEFCAADVFLSRQRVHRFERGDEWGKKRRGGGRLCCSLTGHKP